MSVTFFSWPLAEDAALELLELGGGPGRNVDYQPVADVLQAIDAGSNGAGADQDIDVACQEAVKAGLSSPV